MELQNVRTTTTWNDAAERINRNNLKIGTEITKLQNATYKNKGYYATLAELQSAFPEGSVGSRAYVGSAYPYSIYLWQNGAWVDSGATGGEEELELGNYYNKTEVDAQLTELSWEKGNINGNNGAEEPNEYVSRTPYIPCKKGDVISGPKYRIKLFDKKLSFLTEVIPSGEDSAPIDYNIENNEVAYIRIVTRNQYIGELYINGASLVYSCLNEIPKELLHQKNDINESLDGIMDKISRREETTGTFPYQGAIKRDGSFVSSTAFKTSEYVDLTNVESIEYCSYIIDGYQQLCVAFYTEEKTFISGVETCEAQVRKIDKSDFPTNAHYVRINTLASESKSYYKIVNLFTIADEVAQLNQYYNELDKKSDETAKELDIVQEEIGTRVIPFNGKAYANYEFPFVKGQTISDFEGVNGIYIIYADNTSSLLLKGQLPYIIAREDAVKFSPTTEGAGKLFVGGTIYSRFKNYDNAFFSQGYWLIHSATQDSQYVHTCQFPCRQGDTIKGKFKDIRLLAEKRNYIGALSYQADGVVIDNADVRYAVINIAKGEEDIATLQINGVPIISHIANAYFNKDRITASYPFATYQLPYNIYNELLTPLRMRSNMNGCILGLWVKGSRDSQYYLTGFRYRQQLADWANTENTQVVIAEKKSDNSVVYHQVVNDSTSASINDEIQVFDSDAFKLIVDWRLAAKGTGEANPVSDIVKLDSITFNKNNTIYLLNDDNGNGNGNDNGNSVDNSLDENPYIAMPIPQLAIVNIVAGSLPTTKTDDILATLEFNDMQGNVFAKKIIMNAQGTSSLGLPKKNISIDIMDENYEDSHEIKFGDWVAQDGFHLKAYMLDGVRVKPMAAYDFYESMLLTRGVRKDRAWKRLQLPADISMTSNDIGDSYLQIDDGAKNHPSGFPIILYFNGVFHGIYCWQLKKHRANYHQKKSKAEHIHLDGNISNILLWEANGVINWNKWAGKEMESESIQNKDGIEVRNPKKLILTNGTEYDADTNAGELISTSSPSYNPNNADMVRTASVRANIESLSRKVYALTQMAKGAEKKSAIAEVFDVDSIIDYIIFSQITGNLDGYKKNWQWITYDGVKWAVNAYDLDGTWGWSSWNYYAPYTSWIHNDTPPVTLIIENYLDEIKARYKELRDKGVIDLAKIMQPLVNYVKVIGIDYYDMEFKKWTDGARDNLWRFESWMEESIKRTDALMGYNS